MTSIIELTEPLQMSARDVRDIQALREVPKKPEQGITVIGETDDELLRRVLLAGVQKIREEQADTAYAALAEDPEYQEYHRQRRAARKNAN